MAMVKLAVEKREKLGTAECRRLRRQGILPGNVYGHGLDPVAVKFPRESFMSILRQGTQVVELELEGQNETAIIREIRWDSLSTVVQHIDLVRVDPNERVSVEVPIELRGVAPGVTDGGVLDQQLRSLAVDCPAVSIPDKINIRIGSLQINDAILVNDLELPDDVVVQTDGESVVVRVNEPVEELEEDEEQGEISAAEPEVIGRKDKEDESDED